MVIFSDLTSHFTLWRYFNSQKLQKTDNNVQRINVKSEFVKNTKTWKVEQNV